MKQKRHTVDQIIAKLRRADVEIGQGKKVPEVCRLLEITEQTYYRWRQKYGGMQPEMAKELKALQKGGVQNLYTGNVSIGRHDLQLKIIGEHMDGAHFERKTSHAFTKDNTAKEIDVTLDFAARENEVRISDR